MAALVKKQKVEDEEDQQIIKPEHITPNVDTSDWPLLLRNWDQREIFHHHCPGRHIALTLALAQSLSAQVTLHPFPPDAHL